MNAGSMIAPWLHNSLRPRSGGVPAPLSLMLILFLSLTLGQTTAPHAAPQTDPPPRHSETPPHNPDPPPTHPDPLPCRPDPSPRHPAPLPSHPAPLPCHSERSEESPTAPPHAAPQIKPTLADLEGTWEIQEEERTYVATLDAHGNGPYTHEGGTFTTTTLEGRRWSGKWAQTGNDREGEFEVLLSEDGSTAEGRWWYTRVGTFTHIPARVYGGPYFFKRRDPKTDSHVQP